MPAWLFVQSHCLQLGSHGEQNQLQSLTCTHKKCLTSCCRCSFLGLTFQQLICSRVHYYQHWVPVFSCYVLINVSNSQTLSLTYFSGKVLEVSNLQHRKIIKLHPGLVAQGFGVAALRGYFIEISLTLLGQKTQNQSFKEPAEVLEQESFRGRRGQLSSLPRDKANLSTQGGKEMEFFPGPPQEPKLVLPLGFAWPCCARHDNSPQCYRARPRI